MPKRIPVSAAQDVAEKFDARQVVLVVWDGKLTHVVTYGRTVDDCDQAAIGGNAVKSALGWPESLCDDKPSRVKKLEAENQRLTDLVRHQRHELHEAKLLSDEEFAALVVDSDKGQRVARLESYDEARAKYEKDLAFYKKDYEGSTDL